MATRKIHNKIAKMLVPEAPMRVIDDVNRKVDDPAYLQKYGRYHRQYWGHDPNPHKRDSLVISQGDPMREKIRKIHILVDTDPVIKRKAKRMEIEDQIRNMRR